jgi:hypothetical protein
MVGGDDELNGVGEKTMSAMSVMPSTSEERVRMPGKECMRLRRCIIISMNGDEYG